MPPHQMNQNCAEMMLSQAAALVLNVQLTFDYPKSVPDAQVDLGPAFASSDDGEKLTWYSGCRKDALENSFKTLDKAKTYLLRTGTNNGGGHWQTLYFDHTENGWINYSTELNKFQATKDGSLTKLGEGLLTIHAIWGKEAGQYSFLLVEASPQNLINATNYLYDVRMLGEDKAIDNSFAVSQDKLQFNSNITVQPLQEAVLPQAPILFSPEQEQFRLNFNVLLEKLNQIKGCEKLHKELNDQITALFQSPITTDNFDTFKTACKTTITTAQEEFKKHHGWHALHPILKGFLGLLAALTIIPAIVVQVVADHGYKGTFFNQPPTALSQAVQPVQEEIDNLVKGQK